MRSILETDARLSERLRLNDQASPAHRLASLFAHSGDSWYWGLALIAVWFLGGADWQYRAVALFLAIAATAVVVQAIKWTVRRQRPPGEWGAIYRSVDPHSFPSGHSARAFMLAVLGVALGPAWFAWLLVVWAPLIAVARVATGVHYVSDVAAGAILGVLFGVIIAAALPALVPVLPPILLPSPGVLSPGSLALLHSSFL